MEISQLTDHQITELMNQSKEVYLANLLKEKVIDEETFTNALKYSIVCTRKGFFGRTFDKIFKKYEEGSFLIAIVKVINLVEKDE